jgi:hypothetical protein
MNTELQANIEKLYAAFSDVPKPQIIEGCPCCIERKGVDVLLTTPLRQITPDQLTNYASSVFNTVGCLEDFFYFIPRILEISASDPSWWPDPEVISMAIKRSGFQTWPESRKTSLIRYYNAVLDHLLAVDDSGWEMDSWICALGRLFNDVSPFLSRLADNSSKIVEYYEVNSQCLIKGKLTNSFWDENATEAQDQVIKWFNSEPVRTAINSHYGI